jgi:two-component sensor histidine kinase
MEALIDFNRDRNPRVYGRASDAIRNLERQVLTLNAALREKDVELERAKVLTEEIEHRVRNSLHVVSSLIQLQALVPSMENPQAELLTAAGRVTAIGRVLQLVSHEATEEYVATREYIRLLCQDLTTILGLPVEGYALEGEDDIYLCAETIISIGLIVNEAVTNASKCGATSVSVALKKCFDARLELSISDNGPGLEDGFDPASSCGLGMKVISNSANQLGGSLTCHALPNGSGSVFSVKFFAGARLILANIDAVVTKSK